MGITITNILKVAELAIGGEVLKLKKKFAAKNKISLRLKNLKKIYKN